MNASRPEAYIIRGGEKGRQRLGILSRILAASTNALLDRVGPIEGAQIIDMGCGGGDVALELARRAGPHGHVWGYDLDSRILELARSEAEDAGQSNVTFAEVDIAGVWPRRAASIIYARFILTHVPDPAAVVGRAWKALSPGGTMIVEDIDMEGRFWDPPVAALTRMTELYMEAARRRGCDPTIGRRLVRLLGHAGFENVESNLVQPFGRAGDIKELAKLDFANIADAIVSLGLLGRAEADALAAQVNAYAERSDTTISLPRVFQVVARKK
ncbi:MAG: methyltransferase domain-containing protein [Hyphomicrobiales bacterium]